MADWDKRRENREASTRMLEEAGYPFTSHNGGAHLHLIHCGHTVEFWPGTGLFHCSNGKKARGIRNLLSFLESVAPMPAAIEFENDSWLAKQRRDHTATYYTEYAKHGC